MSFKWAGTVKSIGKEDKFRVFVWHRDEAGENMKLVVACDWERRIVMEECNKREVVGNKGEQVSERKL